MASWQGHGYKFIITCKFKSSRGSHAEYRWHDSLGMMLAADKSLQWQVKLPGRHNGRADPAADVS